MSKRIAAADVSVGSRIRMARLMSGLSQEKLAEHLGLTFQQVQKYEKGTNRVAPSRLKVIAQVTGQSISWFFDEAPGAKKGTQSPLEVLGTSREGLRLATAFVAISSTKIRHSIVDMVEAINR